jgi:hypothetical protein
MTARGGYVHLCDANPDEWVMLPVFGLLVDSQGRSERIGLELPAQPAESSTPIWNIPCPYGDIREALVTQVTERMLGEGLQPPCTLVIVSAQGRVLAFRLDVEVEEATETARVRADELCGANCGRDVDGPDPIMGFVLDRQGRAFGFRVCPPADEEDYPDAEG